MGATQTFMAEIGADAHGPMRYAKPGDTFIERYGGREWSVTVGKDARRPRSYPAASDVWVAPVTVTEITTHV
jgi:hypothetical protein